LAKGHHIIGLHNQSRADDASRPYRVIVADISDAADTKRLHEEIGHCDAIIHAAATLNMDLYSSEVIRANCLGVQNMLWLAAQCVSTHFVFLSSLPLIGTPQIQPIDEEHPTRPATAYHASKLFGEQLVGIAASQGINAVSLRLPAPVGPGMPKNRLLSVLVRRALNHETIELSGQGTRQQNYIDIRDIAQAVQLCLENQLSGVFNIASVSCISNLDLARRCIELCRSTSVIAFNGKSDVEDGYVWDVSIEKARKELGYNPQYVIDAAIEAAIVDLNKMNTLK
jgi:nucleoside-diphosphate-sugar epimerase